MTDCACLKKKMRTKILTPWFLINLFIHISRTIARDTISLTTPLTDDETLVSDGGTFVLGFFTPANTHNRYVGLWYNKISVQTIVWVANRGQPIPDTTGTLKLSKNGNLIITNQNSTIFWSSDTASVITNPVAKLLDNGNLVVAEANTIKTGSFAWQSFDHPTDNMLPGMKLGVDLRTGLNRNLTAWKSETDPSPGDYVLAMQIRGNPELTAWSGKKRMWRSGPWNGEAFTGSTETTTFRDFRYRFVNTKAEIYYEYDTTDKSILTTMVLNHTGVTQTYVWLGGKAGWGLFWYTPKTQCDGYSLCGSYGICSIDTSPMCRCLQGFKPRMPGNWALRDGSGGCVRRTALDCRNGTDGFMTLSRATLPDTSNAMVDMSMNLGECRAACLRNCSCTAYASADVRDGGRGCLIWVTELEDFGVLYNGGQDLYVRLAAADLESISSQTKKKGGRTLLLTVGIIAGVLLVASIALCVWIVKKRRSKVARTNLSVVHDSNDHEKDSLELPFFDLDTVINATGNFAEENILGEGGFGPVYKGKLEQEGQEIAVKRLSRTSIQGVDEFKNEVRLIAKLQHRNLVRLLGYSMQGEERMLIYEYMPNRSLDAYLFDKHRGVYLDWNTRYNIIIGIARGLLYLHQDSRFKIIHRDLKASNVLLDKEMNPKISDFGMARMFSEGETSNRTRKVVGTFGYMSPEYAMDGIFSDKSDVFSFGVIVLEIISGQRNKGVYLADPHLYLLGMAWSLWNEGRSIDLIDSSIGSSITTDEVMRCINIGLLCVQERPEDRPTMASVLLMLVDREASLRKPRQPGFLAGRTSNEEEASPNIEESHSVNHVTVTVTVGR